MANTSDRPPRITGLSGHGAPTHVPFRQTAHGGRVPLPHGSQQSDVCEQPEAKSAMQFGATHTPVASGRLCWHTSPGAQTGGGANTLPPQGPPAPDTQPQATGEPGSISHLPPPGQAPPQVPAESAAHARTHRAAGPPQHDGSPVAVAQMHRCSHDPPTQWSTVQPSSSLQSASVAHVGAGVGDGGRLGTQVHPAFAESTHVPIRHGAAGQMLPGKQGGQIAQAPPHGALSHAGVGVARGVGVAGGTQTQPLEVICQLPTRSAGPLQIIPNGQGNPIAHAPSHGTL